MDENDVIEIFREHIHKQFPRDCSCCKKHFATFADWIRNTSFLGKPVCYDAEMRIFKPFKPLGTFGMVNCSCGSTLALSSKNMKLTTMWKLLKWGRKEMKKRGCTPSDILDDLRRKVDESELRNNATEQKNNLVKAI